MADPIARKRLKKKMLERWENEGGSIATDATSADANRPTSENKGHGKKLSSPRRKSSPRDNSTVGTPAFPAKTRKPTRK